MHALVRRQYFEGGKRSIEGELYHCLCWWRTTLASSTPRSLFFNPSPWATVITDACGEGHLGAVIITDKDKISPYPTYECHAPPWMGEHGIHELELLAALLGVCALATYQKEIPFLLCVDNQSSLQAIIRGKGNSKRANRIIATIWRIIVENKFFPWVEYIRSEFNLADGPSRLCGKEKKNDGTFRYVDTPVLFKRVSATPETMDSAGLHGTHHLPYCSDIWRCPIEYKDLE